MKSFLIIIMVCFLGCKKAIKKDFKLSNTISLVQNKVIKSKEVFRVKFDKNNFDLKFINNFKLVNDTVYTVFRNNLLKLNIDASYLESSSSNNLFLGADKIKNFDYIFDFEKLTNNNYLFTNFNSVIVYDQNLKSTINTYSEERIIYSCLGFNYSMVCNYKGVKLLNEGLNMIDNIEFSFTNDLFIKSDSGFVYIDSFSRKLTHFYVSSEGKIKTNILKSINLKEKISDPDNFYISLITENYIIGHNYNDRRYVYFIDRNNYNTIKKILISDELKYSKKFLQNEEGQPNLKIIKNKDFYYILILNEVQELILFRIPRWR